MNPLPESATPSQAEFQIPGPHMRPILGLVFMVIILGGYALLAQYRDWWPFSQTKESNHITKEEWGVAFEKGPTWNVKEDSDSLILEQASGKNAGDEMIIRHFKSHSITDEDAKFGPVTYFYSYRKGKWMEMREGVISEAKPRFLLGDTPVFVGTRRWLTYIIPLDQGSILKLTITGSGDTQPLIDLVKTMNYTGSGPAFNFCEDYWTLSNHVSNIIVRPDRQDILLPNESVITSFRWKRGQDEPFVTYPAIRGVQTFYEADLRKSRLEANDKITLTVKEISDLLAQGITQKAASLGLTPDTLNTLPLQTFSTKDMLRTLAFREGDSLYSIVLEGVMGHQAPGQGTVTVTCGRAVSEFDTVYDALDFKSDPSVEDPYNRDYVQIADVSPDYTVYALVGSPNHIKIADYYSTSTSEFVSRDSYPAQCEDLEDKKVGKGMRCVEKYPSSIFRTVK